MRHLPLHPHQREACWSRLGARQSHLAFAFLDPHVSLFSSCWLDFKDSYSRLLGTLRLHPCVETSHAGEPTNRSTLPISQAQRQTWIAYQLVESRSPRRSCRRWKRLWHECLRKLWPIEFSSCPRSYRLAARYLTSSKCQRDRSQQWTNNYFWAQVVLERQIHWM